VTRHLQPLAVGATRQCSTFWGLQRNLWPGSTRPCSLDFWTAIGLGLGLGLIGWIGNGIGWMLKHAVLQHAFQNFAVLNYANLYVIL